MWWLEGRRILNTMKNILLPIALLVAMIAPAVLRAQAAEESTIEGVLKKHFISSSMTLGKNSLRYIKADINGSTYWMTVDSGADSIIVDKKIATLNKVKLTPVGEASGVSKTASMAYTGKVDSFKIDSTLSLGSPTVHFLDLSNIGTIKFKDGTKAPNSGQLGLGFFNATRTAIDYPNNKILVAKSNIKGGLSGLLIQLGDSEAKMVQAPNGRHYVHCEVKGHKVLFLVDTGAGANVIYAAAAKALKLEVKTTKTKVNTLGGKGGKSKITRLKQFKFGSVSLGGNIQMLVLPTQGKLKKIDGTTVVGIVGGTLFDALKATIDFDSDTITMAITRKK